MGIAHELAVIVKVDSDVRKDNRIIPIIQIQGKVIGMNATTSSNFLKFGRSDIPKNGRLFVPVCG